MLLPCWFLANLCRPTHALPLQILPCVNIYVQFGACPFHTRCANTLHHMWSIVACASYENDRWKEAGPTCCRLHHLLAFVSSCHTCLPEACRRNGDHIYYITFQKKKTKTGTMLDSPRIQDNNWLMTRSIQILQERGLCITCSLSRPTCVHSRLSLQVLKKKREKKNSIPFFAHSHTPSPSLIEVAGRHWRGSIRVNCASHSLPCLLQ